MTRIRPFLLAPERARRVGGAIFSEWVSTEDDYRTVEQEWGPTPAGDGSP